MAEEIEGEQIPRAGTSLDDAAQVWGKELALESGEEPESEDNQPDPEVPEEVEEPEDEQDDELEEEEEDEKAEPEQQLYKVRSDGEDLNVGLDELLSSYSRQSSYTKKSQSLAEAKKVFEQESADSREIRAQALKILENAKAAQTQAPEKDAQYWQDLKTMDPMQYLVERDEVREQQFQSQYQDQQIETLKAQEAAEQRANLESYVDSQKGVLAELIPEWADQKVADAEKKLILAYGLKTGFSQEELDNTFDARAASTMRKAALYDQLTTKRKGLKPSVKTSMKGGSQSDPRTVKSGKASARLKKSGSVDDAASVFYNMIRSK
jgi:hypothetical protein